jgi:hypothetical protein
MAVNTSRSMNADLLLGSRIDGAVKTLFPDRGGDIEQEHATQRASELQPQYNVAHNFHSYSDYCTCPDCV